MTHLPQTRAALLKAIEQATTALAEARKPHDVSLTERQAAVEVSAAALREAQGAHQRAQQELDELTATQSRVTTDLSGSISQARQARDLAAQILHGTGVNHEAACASLTEARKPIRVWLDLCASLNEALARLDEEEAKVGATISSFEQADIRRAEEEEAARRRCKHCNDDPAYGYCRECDPSR
ncbi:MAG: hypothetical protein K2W95_28725 [Candidatus Obscuribacterales bacterium]|nr:hypothetical protein [Candidatus Obscuribacterales bacterium]